MTNEDAKRAIKNVYDLAQQKINDWKEDIESFGSSDEQDELVRWSGKGADSEQLIEVRAFENGNMHVRLGQDFALALNVEYGRLKGWLKNGAAAAEELKDEAAPKHFGKNHSITDAARLLTA